VYKILAGKEEKVNQSAFSVSAHSQTFACLLLRLFIALPQCQLLHFTGSHRSSPATGQ